MPDLIDQLVSYGDALERSLTSDAPVVMADPVPSRSTRHRARRVVLAAAVGVTVAGIVGVFATTRDQSEPEAPRVSTVAPEPVRPRTYVWPDAALGAQIERLTEPIDAPRQNPPAWQQVFADADGTHRVLVETNYDKRPQILQGPGSEAVQIGTVAGRFMQAPGSKITAVEMTLPCGNVMMTALGVARDSLLAAASTARCERREGANDAATIEPPPGLARRLDRSSPSGLNTTSYTIAPSSPEKMDRLNVSMAPGQSFDDPWLTNSAVSRRTVIDGDRTYGVLEFEGTMNGALTTMQNVVFVEGGTLVYVYSHGWEGSAATADGLIAAARSLVPIDEATFLQRIAETRASWDKGAYFLLDPLPEGFSALASEDRSSARLDVSAPPTATMPYRSVGVSFRKTQPAWPQVPGRESRPATTPGGRAVQVRQFSMPAPGPGDGSVVPGFAQMQVDWTDGETILTLSAQLADDTEAMLLDLVDRARQVDHQTFEAYRATHAR